MQPGSGHASDDQAQQRTCRISNTAALEEEEEEQLWGPSKTRHSKVDRAVLSARSTYSVLTHTDYPPVGRCRELRRRVYCT